MGISPTFDKERISLNLVRYKKAGKIFEINVDPDMAVLAKEGKEVDIHEVLKAEKIFCDAKKGLLASDNDIMSVFNTQDILGVASIIIKEGEIQLTQEYRQKLREEKFRKIINIIHVNGVDPRTHAPHPLTRIENAFAEANIRVDEFKDAQSQVKDILQKLKPIMPISFETKVLLIKIPAAYAPKCFGVVKGFGKIMKEDWQSDGSWHARVELPAGLADELFDKLNSMTHGNVESETLKNN